MAGAKRFGPKDMLRLIEKSGKTGTSSKEAGRVSGLPPTRCQYLLHKLWVEDLIDRQVDEGAEKKGPYRYYKHGAAPWRENWKQL